MTRVPAIVVAARSAPPPGTRPPALYPLYGLPLGAHLLRAARDAAIGPLTLVGPPPVVAALAEAGVEVERLAAATPEEQLAAMAAVARRHGADSPLLLLAAEVGGVVAAEIASLAGRCAGAEAILVARAGGGEPLALAFPRAGWLAELAAGDPGVHWPLAWLAQRIAQRGLATREETALPGFPVWEPRALPRAREFLSRVILDRLLAAGVLVIDPATTAVDVDVSIAPDAILHPFCVLEGRTRIGPGAEIGPGVRLIDAEIGADTQVQYSVITDSVVGARCRIGPFAQLRPGCRVGDGVRVGNFVELKNATLEEGVAASHLTYLGDAVVGAHANIGAGTITCNYDGQRKHRTQIGPGAFIGSHATLIAPVTIEAGAYVAAASPITEDVPADALAIARCRQTIKAGWARKRREGG